MARPNSPRLEFSKSPSCTYGFMPSHCTPQQADAISLRVFRDVDPDTTYQRKYFQKLPRYMRKDRPLIAVIVPLYNEPGHALIRTLQGLALQQFDLNRAFGEFAPILDVVVIADGYDKVSESMSEELYSLFLHSAALVEGDADPAPRRGGGSSEDGDTDRAPFSSMNTFIYMPCVRGEVEDDNGDGLRPGPSGAGERRSRRDSRRLLKHIPSEYADQQPTHHPPAPQHHTAGVHHGSAAGHGGGGGGGGGGGSSSVVAGIGGRERAASGGSGTAGVSSRRSSAASDAQADAASFFAPDEKDDEPHAGGAGGSRHPSVVGGGAPVGVGGVALVHPPVGPPAGESAAGGAGAGQQHHAATAMSVPTASSATAGVLDDDEVPAPGKGSGADLDDEFDAEVPPGRPTNRERSGDGFVSDEDEDGGTGEGAKAGALRSVRHVEMQAPGSGRASRHQVLQGYGQRRRSSRKSNSFKSVPAEYQQGGGVVGGGGGGGMHHSRHGQRFAAVERAATFFDVSSAQKSFSPYYVSPHESSFMILDSYQWCLPLYVSLLVKRFNRKKHHSYEWFVRGFCPRCDPDLILGTDCGTLYGRDMLVGLVSRICSSSRFSACSGHQRVMSYAMQFDPERAAAAGNPQPRPLSDVVLRCVQGFDFTSGQLLFNPAASLIEFLPVAPGPCALYRYQYMARTIDEHPSAFDHYFQVVCKRLATADLVTANLRIAEDRILTYASVLDAVRLTHNGNVWERSCTNVYEPSATFFFESEAPMSELVKQRRRWLNGTLAGYFWLLYVLMFDCRAAPRQHSCFYRLLTIMNTFAQLGTSINAIFLTPALTIISFYVSLGGMALLIAVLLRPELLETSNKPYDTFVPEITAGFGTTALVLVCLYAVALGANLVFAQYSPFNPITWAAVTALGAIVAVVVFGGLFLGIAVSFVYPDALQHQLAVLVCRFEPGPRPRRLCAEEQGPAIWYWARIAVIVVVIFFAMPYVFAFLLRGIEELYSLIISAVFYYLALPTMNGALPGYALSRVSDVSWGNKQGAAGGGLGKKKRAAAAPRLAQDMNPMSLLVAVEDSDAFMTTDDKSHTSIATLQQERLRRQRQFIEANEQQVFFEGTSNIRFLLVLSILATAVIIGFVIIYFQPLYPLLIIFVGMAGLAPIVPIMTMSLLFILRRLVTGRPRVPKFSSGAEARQRMSGVPEALRVKHYLRPHVEP